MKIFGLEEAYQMVVSYLDDVRKTGSLSFTWEEEDIRSQCTIGRSQADIIGLCNRAIVRAISSDNIISLQKEEARSRKSNWI